MASPANNLGFPPPSSDHHSTVIVIVFVSFGCLCFLVFLAVALFCFIKKWKKKRTVRETEIIRKDEHLKIKEAIVHGPHGQDAVSLSIDDDVHVDEVIRKDEEFGEEFGEGRHAKSAHNQPNLPISIEEEPSPSSSSRHHPEHKS